MNALLHFLNYLDNISALSIFLTLAVIFNIFFLISLYNNYRRDKNTKNE